MRMPHAKKAIKVKGHKRADGTKVKAHTRKVDSARRVAASRAVVKEASDNDLTSQGKHRENERKVAPAGIDRYNFGRGHIPSQLDSNKMQQVMDRPIHAERLATAGYRKKTGRKGWLWGGDSDRD